jgi:hypothetical protein
LIEACEAIKRNGEMTRESNKTNDNNNKNSKNGKTKTSAKNSGKKHSAGDNSKHFCSEHGHNPSHDTSDCWTLQNRTKKANVGHDGIKKRSFSNKSFRKEINFLAKKSSKAKVLDLYATAVKREQAKLAKQKKDKKCKADSDSDSDSEASVNIIQETKPRVKSILKKKKKKKKNADVTAEESAYRAHFTNWLKDHGEPLADASTEKTDEESADGSTEAE